MAYKKEYPVVNSELEKDSIFEYTKRQEDRIDNEFNLKSDKNYVDDKFNNLFGKNTTIKTVKIDDTTNLNGTVIALRGITKNNTTMLTVAGIGLNATTDYAGVSVYPRWNVNDSRIELFFTKNDKPLTNTRVIVWVTVVEFES